MVGVIAGTLWNFIMGLNHYEVHVAAAIHSITVTSQTWHHLSRHIIQLIQQQLLVATVWRHVLGSRRRGCSVYGWHVFLQQLTTPICCLVGRLLYKKRRMGGRQVSAGARVRSVGSVPGQALTRVWACVCVCVCVGYVGLYASYSDLLSVNQRHAALAVDWCRPLSWLQPAVQGGRWAVEQQQQHGLDAAAVMPARCAARMSYKLPLIELTYRQLLVWRHTCSTKYLPGRQEFVGRRHCTCFPHLFNMLTLALSTFVVQLIICPIAIAL